MIRDITLAEIIGSKDYDDFVEKAKQIDQAVDDGQWHIGDMVVAMIEYVEAKKGTKYGENVAERFSIDTRIPLKTVQEYYSMSKYWKPDIREKVIQDYAVNRSIMQVAKKVSKRPRRAIAFLRLCSMPTTVLDESKPASEQDAISSVRQYNAMRMKLLGKNIQKPIRIDNLLVQELEDGTVVFIAKNISDEDLEKIKQGQVYKAKLTLKDEVLDDAD